MVTERFTRRILNLIRKSSRLSFRPGLSTLHSPLSNWCNFSGVSLVPRYGRDAPVEQRALASLIRSHFRSHFQAWKVADKCGDPAVGGRFSLYESGCV